MKIMYFYDSRVSQGCVGETRDAGGAVEAKGRGETAKGKTYGVTELRARWFVCGKKGYDVNSLTVATTDRSNLAELSSSSAASHQVSVHLPLRKISPFYRSAIFRVSATTGGKVMGRY